MRIFLIGVLAALASPLAAQQAAAPLGVFATLQGHWQGPAWSLRREGRVEVTQDEWVWTEAGGKVIAVRGLGTRSNAGKVDTVHHAFAVMHLNHEGTALQMRAFTAEGRWIDPEIEVTEKGYTWRMTDPRVGKIRYEMPFIPDPVAWTEVPESTKVLSRQRERWHRGLLAAMWQYKTMLFNPRYGRVGLLAMPFFAFGEMLAPVIELIGYVLTVVGLQVGSLLAGAILTETIFSWPGIGRWVYESIESRDYPIVQGASLFIGVVVVVVNLLTDLLYAAVDPRIKYD